MSNPLNPRTTGRLKLTLVLLLLSATAIPARSEAGPLEWLRGLRPGRRAALCTSPRRNAELLGLGVAHQRRGRPTRLRQWMSQSMSPATCAALTNLIASKKRGAATFDADGTLWQGDVGEGFFAWMMKNRHYPAENLPMLEQAWRGYKAGTFDGEKMYELMVTGMAGMKEQEVSRLARSYFDTVHKRSIYQPMAVLVSALRETGFAPWVVSGSPYWVVAAGARHFGIDESRVIGLKVRVDHDGRLTDEVLRPVPWKAGKAQRILGEIGQAPVIAAGNSKGDLQMLQIASDLSLVINPAPDMRRALTGRRGLVNIFGSSDTLDRWRRSTVRAPAPRVTSSPATTVSTGFPVTMVP